MRRVEGVSGAGGVSTLSTGRAESIRSEPVRPPTEGSGDETGEKLDAIA